MNAGVYLDHCATSPLRPEARAAMAAAFDVTGNPSSVHASGRAARALLEEARARVAILAGAPLPRLEDSRYRSRIYRGMAITV